MSLNHTIVRSLWSCRIVRSLRKLMVVYDRYNNYNSYNCYNKTLFSDRANVLLYLFSGKVSAKLSPLCSMHILLIAIYLMLLFKSVDETS